MKSIKTIVVSATEDTISINKFPSVQKAAEFLGCDGDKLRDDLRTAYREALEKDIDVVRGDSRVYYGNTVEVSVWQRTEVI